LTTGEASTREEAKRRRKATSRFLNCILRKRRGRGGEGEKRRSWE
jgi:hypothetical protein